MAAVGDFGMGVSIWNLEISGESSNGVNKYGPMAGVGRNITGKVL